MSVSRKLLMLLGIPFLTFASTFSFSGPSYQPSQGGGPCVPGTPHCVIGDLLAFNIFGVELTQPSATNPNWILTIATNYGATPGGSPVFPTFYLGGLTSGPHGDFSIGDFLILSNNAFYAIVLSSHDGYTPGNLYKASGFLTSADVMGDHVSPRPEVPVWLAGGGSLLGTGALSVAKTGDGTSSALYTITDQFSAPADFLSKGDFVFDFSSYVCANGFETGHGDVPEPRGLFLLVPVVLLVGRRIGRLVA
jgi:hypothetical protein